MTTQRFRFMTRLPNNSTAAGNAVLADLRPYLLYGPGPQQGDILWGQDAVSWTPMEHRWIHRANINNPTNWASAWEWPEEDQDPPYYGINLDWELDLGQQDVDDIQAIRDQVDAEIAQHKADFGRFSDGTDMYIPMGGFFHLNNLDLVGPQLMHLMDYVVFGKSDFRCADIPIAQPGHESNDYRPYAAMAKAAGRPFFLLFPSTDQDPVDDVEMACMILAAITPASGSGWEWQGAAGFSVFYENTDVETIPELGHEVIMGALRIRDRIGNGMFR